MAQGTGNNAPYQMILMGRVIYGCLVHQAWLEVLFPRPTVLVLHVYLLVLLTLSRCCSLLEKLQNLQPEENIDIKTKNGSYCVLHILLLVTQQAISPITLSATCISNQQSLPYPVQRTVLQNSRWYIDLLLTSQVKLLAKNRLNSIQRNDNRLQRVGGQF